MTAYAFGAGTLIGVRTDISNPTPTPFGVVQSAEVDFDYALKELVGQSQVAVALARGQLKITGKVKSARIYATQYTNLFFGPGFTQATGALLQAVNEAGSIPTTPYQVTTVNAANWVTDLGVYYAATGVQLSRVASAPATGQYSVAAGVYTFAAADTGLGVLINYTYTATTGAQKISLSNQLMGSQPTVQINLGETFNSKVCNMQLNSCVFNKLSFPFKNSDFVVHDWEFEAAVDAASNIGFITTSE